jgi:hypothetical protein
LPRWQAAAYNSSAAYFWFCNIPSEASVNPEDFNYGNLAGIVLRAHTCDGRTESAAFLGSRLIDFHSQKMRAAAKAMADRKTLGHLS